MEALSTAMPRNSTPAHKPKTTSVSARKWNMYSRNDPDGQRCAQWEKRLMQKVCTTASANNTVARSSMEVMANSGDCIAYRSTRIQRGMTFLAAQSYKRLLDKTSHARYPQI